MSQMTSLTASWLLVILNHERILNDFRAQVSYKVFERAEIARCQHCNADNFKTLQADYMLIRLLNAQMMTK